MAPTPVFSWRTCLWSYKGRTRLSDCTTTTTTEGEEGRGIPRHLSSETCKGLSQGTRRQNATGAGGAGRGVPRAPAAGKGRSGAGVRQVRGREGGPAGNGDQAASPRASELYLRREKQDFGRRGSKDGSSAGLTAKEIMYLLARCSEPPCQEAWPQEEASI